MNCPKCGTLMSIGTAHDDNSIYQFECECGYIESVESEVNEPEVKYAKESDLNELRTEIRKLTPHYKPGWKAISSWICLILVLGMLYLIWKCIEHYVYGVPVYIPYIGVWK
jgi:ribosomal protein S27AE